MNIAFDIDDVLASFQLAWIDYNNANYGTNHTIEDFTEFDYVKSMNLTQEESFRRLHEFLDTPSLSLLDPLPHAQQIVDELRKNHPLFVITSRNLKHKDITLQWITQHYGNVFTEIFFTGQLGLKGFDHTVTKAEVCLNNNIDLLVEDAALYAQQVVDAGIHVALLEKPWNRSILFTNQKLHRISAIEQLPALVQEVSTLI